MDGIWLCLAFGLSMYLVVTLGRVASDLHEIARSLRSLMGPRELPPKNPVPPLTKAEVDKARDELLADLDSMKGHKL